jgi:hypothetical protein
MTSQSAANGYAYYLPWLLRREVVESLKVTSDLHNRFAKKREEFYIYSPIRQYGVMI